MYSCGGYVVSLPTVRTPGSFKSFGGVTVGVLGFTVGTLLLPVLVFLPQAAKSNASMTTHPRNSGTLARDALTEAWRPSDLGEKKIMKRPPLIRDRYKKMSLRLLISIV